MKTKIFIRVKVADETYQLPLTVISKREFPNQKIPGLEERYNVIIARVDKDEFLENAGQAIKEILEK